MDFVLRIVTILPKNIISYLTGALVRVKWPRPMSRWINAQFVDYFGIDMSEAEFALDSYETIEDVFTRRLKQDARPIQGPVCSPADGTLSFSLAAENNTAIQAKGLSYRLDELFFGEESHFVDLKWYSTVYLAPHNYHRVHSPVSGMLQQIRYYPGDLWPVNAAAVRWVPHLFIRNERLIFDIETEEGGFVYIAMVGAFNVGRIQPTAKTGFYTNPFPHSVSHSPPKLSIQPTAIKAGDELGIFMLGSTVVLGFDRLLMERHRFVQTSENTSIMMGQSLLQ